MDAERWTGIADGDFRDPYVDIDEWRDEPARHRYVHGGFGGTDTRFSIYLPPAEEYDGRFFQHITPVPDSEHLAQTVTGQGDKIGFSIASGAYFLETNGGGAPGRPGSSVDPTIAAYRANGAAALHSRVIAAQMYGEHRPFGYAYGGSGGGYRTIGGAENTSGVWDGFVPYVIGSPMAIPSMFTVRMHAQRLLRDRFDAIVDALEPGGSGDPFDGLDDEEGAALVEVTRMGFPPRSWFGHRTMGMHAFPVLYGGMRLADPSYFEHDFWHEPGYLGHALPPSFQRDIVQLRAEIVATITPSEAEALGLRAGRQPGEARGGVDTAWRGERDAVNTPPVALRLSRAAAFDVQGADLVVHTGALAGRRLGLLAVERDLAVLGPGDPNAIAQLQVGDSVEVDNRGFLAAQTYHRHQVPTPDFAVWDRFRHPNGTPIYPQRPMLLGPLFAAATAGTVQSGRFEGKMIVVCCLLDREALPWQGDWYRSKVREHFGPATDDHFRLWYVDNALHGDDELQESPAHTVSYLGVLQRALRDVSAWVERDVAPADSTGYEVVDGQVVAPAVATARRGVQPVVSLTADGGPRAEVGAGQEVVLRAVAEVPDGTGAIVSVEWDVDGAERFPIRDSVDLAPLVVAERRASFAVPGTYFPTVRVTSQRDTDAGTAYARIQNLARVRVVVGGG